MLVILTSCGERVVHPPKYNCPSITNATGSNSCPWMSTVLLVSFMMSDGFNAVMNGVAVIVSGKLTDENVDVGLLTNTWCTPVL